MVPGTRTGPSGRRESVSDLSSYPKKVKLRKSRKSLSVRLMEQKDETRILNFLKTLPMEHRLFLRDDVADEKTVKRWASFLDYEKVIPLLGEVDRKIVANGSLHLPNLRWMNHVGEIRILVDPKYRGMGIGRTIIHELFGLGLSHGLERIVATQMDSEEFLIQTLVSLGFYEVARIPKHVKDIKGIKHDLVFLIAEAQDVFDQQERMIQEDQFFPLSGQY
jgi:N-acetylglutamate synthase-like GNAT family acetyltransferase